MKLMKTKTESNTVLILHITLINTVKYYGLVCNTINYLLEFLGIAFKMVLLSFSANDQQLGNKSEKLWKLSR